jgi:hypothetical protein
MLVVAGLIALFYAITRENSASTAIRVSNSQDNLLQDGLLLSRGRSQTNALPRANSKAENAKLSLNTEENQRDFLQELLSSRVVSGDLRLTPSLTSNLKLVLGFLQVRMTSSCEM